MAKGDNLAKNGSGYADPTAAKAIRKVDKESEAEYWDSKNRLDDLLDVLKYVIEVSGFELEGRIVLKDKKTGKVWR